MKTAAASADRALSRTETRSRSAHQSSGAGLAEVHTLAGAGHRLGGEVLGRGAAETVVVALGGHRPAEAEAEAEAREQQREAHEREQDADDEGDRAIPARGGAAWSRWWVGGHGRGLPSRRQATSWPGR